MHVNLCMSDSTCNNILPFHLFSIIIYIYATFSFFSQYADVENAYR